MQTDGASVFLDHSDWSPRKAPRSLIYKFLKARAVDYSTKKLQVSSFIDSWPEMDISRLQWKWFLKK